MREMIALQNRLNRLFEDANSGRGTGASARAAHQEEEERGEDVFERVDWHPAADVYERKSEFVIALDAPGIKRDALAIDLDENKLSIRGEREFEQEEQNETGGYRRERPAGRFLRRFSLPSNIDQANIRADYKDGVLRIHLPKRVEEKTRRIAINVQ
jgi:HSP20 family protein